ncbi:Tim10/DDP family zinc finger-domain-containing protein [Lactarius deliciosus]|nr:Tim10/DDP family zinc finger-domain-containing protein [Lactarius deliciosus]
MADRFDDATQVRISRLARVQQSIHTFTSMCWDKCITSTPSTRFSRGEESCLTNCVERFLDTSLFMVKRIESQRQGA